MKHLIRPLVLLAAAAPLAAQWSDDFNRPDGPMGPDWTVVSGAWSIVSQQGAHVSGGVNETLQHNTASLDYTSAIVSLDVFAPGSASQFSGVLIGLGGTNAIMVKIQDQVAGTPGFSNIGIYRGSGTSYGAWGGTGTGFATLTAPFLSGRLKVYFPDADTIVAEIDTDFDGTPDQSYTNDGVLSFANTLGTGLGIVAWGSTALFDNWLVGPGGPPPVTSYCTAGTSTNGCLATASATAQPSASLASPCVISFSNVEGLKQGLILYGIDNSGFVPLPWGSGSTSYFCVKSPVQRAVAMNSGGTLNGCDGALALDWNAYLAANSTALGAPFNAGGKVFAQAWYRDPPAPRKTNLSDAVELTHLP